ncbi:PucR family transcriptional regulator [Microbacterium sp. GXF7504]
MLLRELVDALGDLVQDVVGEVDAERRAERLSVPEHPHDLAAGDLVLLLPTTPDPAAMPAAAAERGAVAVAAKAGSVSTPTATPIPVLVLDPGVTWHAALQRITLVLESGPGDEDPVSDLFDLAEATALAVGGATAVMDDYTRIIAYSSRPEDPIDDIRRDGILGRRVPASMVAAHSEVRTWPAGEVRRVESPGTLARLVAPVRVGDKFLGSVWVVREAAAGPEHRAALAAAARIAALHLMRASSTRAGGAWRVNQSFVQARLLGGAAGPRTDEGEVVVLAAVPRGDLAGEAEIVREQLASVLSLLVAAWPGGGCAVVDDVVHALLPVTGGSGDAVGLARAAVQRVADSIRQEVAIGVSDAVADAPTARLQSLEAARWQAGHGAGVAAFADVRTALVLERAGTALTAADALLPVAAELRRHDREHGSAAAQTLLAFLEHGGNVAAAAEALRVHGNTLRYRLRRIADRFGIDLDDPDTRLALWMSLRLGPRD